MSKYDENLYIEKDFTVTIFGPVKLDGKADAEEFKKELDRTVHFANERRLRARYEKAIDPATYGLKLGQKVRIGKGQKVWILKMLTGSYHMGIDAKLEEFVLDIDRGVPRRMTAKVADLVAAEEVEVS